MIHRRLKENKNMNATKQKYAIYRDNELLASEILSLAAIGMFARNDARNEHAHGRPASYRITGSLGFKRHGSHYKGRLRWEEGKLHLGTPAAIGGFV